MRSNKITAALFAGLAFSLLSPGASAQVQTIMDGAVRLSNVAVSRSEDRLFVTMDIDLEGLDVASNREVILTPTLCAGERTVALPSAMIAGRNRYYHHLRNGLEGEHTTLYRSGGQATIAYRATIPYEEWMGRSELATASRVCGCCGEPLSGASEPLLAIDFAPRRFEPEYLYVRPEAVAKINTIEGSAYIDFPVNRTEIHENYRNNPAELRKILATIDAVRADADTRILSVTIKGYASPEGSYANNERLAKGRTRTLMEYVRSRYDFADGLLATAYEPEDWAGLERFVEGSELKNRDAILALIRSDLAPDAREWKIKRTYPEEYAYLLRTVYPALRHSDYAVRYEVRAYTDVEEIRRLLKSQPQKLSLNEMYMAAQQMEPGSDEYAETFEIAVRMFPDDEVANLNAANTALVRGDLKSAGRYLAKAGDSPEATYARGLLAALDEQYDAARRLFAEARDGGVAQAEGALRQLEQLTGR